MKSEFLNSLDRLILGFYLWIISGGLELPPNQKSWERWHSFEMYLWGKAWTSVVCNF